MKRELGIVLLGCFVGAFWFFSIGVTESVSTHLPLKANICVLSSPLFVVNTSTYAEVAATGACDERARHTLRNARYKSSAQAVDALLRDPCMQAYQKRWLNRHAAKASNAHVWLKFFAREHVRAKAGVFENFLAVLRALRIESNSIGSALDISSGFGYVPYFGRTIMGWAYDATDIYDNLDAGGESLPQDAYNDVTTLLGIKKYVPFFIYRFEPFAWKLGGRRFDLITASWIVFDLHPPGWSGRHYYFLLSELSKLLTPAGVVILEFQKVPSDTGHRFQFLPDAFFKTNNASNGVLTFFYSKAHKRVADFTAHMRQHDSIALTQDALTRIFNIDDGLTT